jgi:thiamine-phosphate pyrophosphorylase
MTDFGLYVIISHPLLPYRTIVETCVEEGIRIIQLREKHLSDREIIDLGRDIQKIIRGTATSLIINDRPDLAAIIGADGYHLGQEDLPIELSTRFYPDASIRGLSTHNLQQVEVALQEAPDYIGFGPVYPTPTKEKPDPTVGTELLQKAVTMSSIPVVAIGGINEKNIEAVLKAGARNIALVRYFMQHNNLRERIKTILETCKHYWR